MTHLFVSENQIENDSVRITGPDRNHLKNVLRVRVGETLSLTTGNGTVLMAEIVDLQGDCITARILAREKEKRELPVKIALFQGYPKGDKMEFILQKSVELGVTEIVPVFTARSIVKLDEKKKNAKKERLEAIVKNAAEQSKRGALPRLHDFLSWAEALRYAKTFSHLFLAYEDARGMKHTRECLKRVAPGETVAVFVGPEGGFSEAEVAEFKTLGGEILTLGKRILRTETAPIALLSMMGYEWESDETDEAIDKAKYESK